MRWITVTCVLSAGAHLALLSGLKEMPQPKFHASEDIKVVVAPKPKPKPKPSKPDKPKPPPPPPDPVKTPHANPRPAAKPQAPSPEPPPEAAQPKTAKNFAPGLSDFGISMSGTSAGGGIAVGPGGGGVGSGGSAPKPKTVVHEKTLKAKKQAEPVADQCDEAMVKAKPKGFVQPQYTDDARSAGVEGRVRLRITIDTSGSVSNATVLSGLGHGLDQAAMAAARLMRFAPATKCGKPVQSSFVISMRFVLGE